MGRRARERGGQPAQATQENTDPDPNKTPEPYTCTGHFNADFRELCRRTHLAVIPPVVPRPRRPPSPSAAPPAQEEQSGRVTVKPGGKRTQIQQQQQQQQEPEPEVEPTGDPPEPPPKTYVLKERSEYFKPSVQVELEHPDKYDTVTEVYVRGWKVDESMMQIFKQCFPKLERLHTVNLWRAGLTEETLEMLVSLLPECPALKTLVLDNNVIKSEPWHLLLKEESPVQHLSLRYNQISDTGAEALGKCLGTINKQNSKLLSLNLTGNLLTDTGAEHLAQGLRMNRTLLCLGLTNNKIGDVGAQKFADVLSRFQLTHEEIVERRKLLSGKDATEAQKPDQKTNVHEQVLSLLTCASGRRQSEETSAPREPRSRGGGGGGGLGAGTPLDPRPPSVRSSHTGGGGGSSTSGTPNATRASAAPTPSASRAGKPGKGKKGDSKGKDDEKEKKSKKDLGASASKRDGKGSKASIVADMSKGQKKSEKTKGRGKQAQQEAEQPDSAELLNPLLDTVERLDNGVVMLVGNRTLISLNLTGNCIGEAGIRDLTLAVGYQTSLAQFRSSTKPGQAGLMRLVVNRNKCPSSSEEMQKLSNLMLTKDPMYKPPAETPDQGPDA